MRAAFAIRYILASAREGMNVQPENLFQAKINEKKKSSSTVDVERCIRSVHKYFIASHVVMQITSNIHGGCRQFMNYGEVRTVQSS